MAELSFTARTVIVSVLAILGSLALMEALRVVEQREAAAQPGNPAPISAPIPTKIASDPIGVSRAPEPEKPQYIKDIERKQYLENQFPFFKDAKEKFLALSAQSALVKGGLADKYLWVRAESNRLQKATEINNILKSCFSEEIDFDDYSPFDKDRPLPDDDKIPDVAMRYDYHLAHYRTESAQIKLDRYEARFISEINILSIDIGNRARPNAN
ncbi:hypothetical protein GCM10011611_30990 [Aliidongia dinghuensis]|uniref:Uncharacterized protein n=2 Tax=Aliidongia dinghuensis TaxID=1867774 RepID=A0A8J2YUH4_9PROT|nr:hypothetical protein GCM10011611_30990 [Aliidongia dinghuensis]